MRFIITLDFLKYMNNHFRVALRIGRSYMESVYCSWPFGTLDVFAAEIVARGPFVGVARINKDEIISIEKKRSVINNYLRITYTQDSSGKRIIDVYCFRLGRLLSTLQEWMVSDELYTGRNCK